MSDKTMPPEWALQRAAQIWCEPAHAKKEMDVDFARSIAQALAEARERALEEAARACAGEGEGYLHDCPCRGRVYALKSAKGGAQNG